MAEAVVRAERLTKRYGRARGIEDVDLEVRRGEVFGFLGPNGAGKTTTIRLMLDLLRPTSGRVEVLGLDPRADGVRLRARLGYLPGELALWDAMTGRETLEYAARLRGTTLGATDAATLARRLDCDLARPVRALSQGNRRKIGLIMAFMHRPELLVLDEPTNGLDPLMQQEFLDLVREARADGRTVFLSSHNLAEVERVCDRVGVVREGRIVAVDTVAALRSRAARRVRVEFAHPPPLAAFEGVEGVSAVRVAGARLECVVSGPMDALVKTLAKLEVRTFDSEEPPLEDLFLTMFNGGARGG